MRDTGARDMDQFLEDAQASVDIEELRREEISRSAAHSSTCPNLYEQESEESDETYI